MTTTAQPPPQRAFGQKYKADDYADYYAQKHGASLSRRFSTHLEARMIRRAINRVREHKPFQLVLDCPSGTGRFLPTLAKLNLSVVAMDTSDAMLREGRTHYSLFDAPPAPAAGSAFQLPLPDNAVDVAICARLLHHIEDSRDRVRILKELARVARAGVVISFFDSASLRAWRRRRKIKKTGKTRGRNAISRAKCEEEARSAGLHLIGMDALFRFHTEVTAAAFLVDAPP